MALTARERTLMIAGGLIAASVAFYMFVHSPLVAKRTEVGDALQTAEMDLRREQAKLKGAGDLVLRKLQLAAREKMVEAEVPGKHAASMFVYHLALAEQMSATRIRAIKLLERTELTPDPQGDPTVTPPIPLTVVKLELHVDGTFGGQMLFNQALEEIPLVLNTDTVGLKRPEIETAGAVQLVWDGRLREAAQLLGLSPPLAGSYTVNIYFTTDKPGPDSSATYFRTEPGRIDPFALDGVDEFLQHLLIFYPSAPPAGEAPSNGPAPTKPQATPPVKQLG